jgi:hypothetical protein
MEIGPGTRLDWTKSGSATLSARVIPDRAVLAKRLAGRGKRYLGAALKIGPKSAV